MAPDFHLPLSSPVLPSLALLGISTPEEALYRALLRWPGSTAQSLVDMLRVPLHEVEATAASLQSKGFATRAPESVPRFFPAPPDIAVESLLLHRQRELLQARHAVADLQREQLAPADGNPLVEIIGADPAAQAQPFAQCHSRVEVEMMCLMRPPFHISVPQPEENLKAGIRKKHVRYRNIVHPDVLVMPGWPETLRDAIEAGEEMRLLADFPFKMIVADRELGLMPLNVDDPAGAMLLLRRSAVLDALCALFETLWSQAVPIRIGADGGLIVDTAAPYAPPLQALVPLLAAGVNDKSAAELLGMSGRTLMRRIDLLYQELGARSRFQAGWLAALHAVKAAGGMADF